MTDKPPNIKKCVVCEKAKRCDYENDDGPVCKGCMFYV